MSAQPDDGERVFDALPPARGAFARSWWGKRWLAALEDTALEAGQLRRGRRYARRGAVGAVSVRPGRVTAVVRDDDGTAQRADVLLQELDEAAWERLLDTVAREAGHLAALLDGEMSPRLVTDADAAGLELLPGIGDLEPACTCEAWDHCPHTAALSYQVARLLDADPFVLLLLRGHDRAAVLKRLERRGAAHGAGADDPAEWLAEDVAGVDAAEAFAFAAVLPPLPPPASGRVADGEPVRVPGLTGVASGQPDSAALEFLAAAAAARARRLTDAAPVHALRPGGVREDAVRLAATEPPPHVADRLAAGSGRSRAELDLAVCAWRCGGAASLAVLEEPWELDQAQRTAARARLAGAWSDGEQAPALGEVANRWTVRSGPGGGGAQVRLGRDGRWWPYRWHGGGWRPAGPGAADPAAALATAVAGDGGEGRG